jgi:GT2 family glycosyltransferase
MKYSFIIPVYNRPDEVDELLDSLTRQTLRDFEVVVVEDGSAIPCREVVSKYAGRLTVHYYNKENSGPGQTRNYGVERANGEYMLILDSDCILPEDYLKEVEAELRAKKADAFGGPDRAHHSFTDVQKAINYAMTSFFTTGGIRGGKKKLDKFYPRSFNMGIRKDVYQALGGFSKMRFGEDIDFSIRIFKAGYACRLFPEAWVWHKRRTDLKKFFKQVHNSGIARINLYKKYPESLKLVHMLPAVFTLGVFVLMLLLLMGIGLGVSIQTGMLQVELPLGVILCSLAVLPLLCYALLIVVDSCLKNRSVKVALLSVPASFIQLIGYGSGFIRAWWKRCVCSKREFSAFEKNFYE